ncbi:MAG: hypothetical protein ACR2RV_20955 [Verrucomicrobiales bacterium]
MKTPVSSLLVLLASLLSAPIALSQIPTLSWDASANLDGDNQWPAAEDAARSWTFATPASAQSGATDFPGAPVWFNSPSAVMASLDGAGGSTMNVSWELVFRPADLTGNHIIFETGGNGDGTAIVMQGADLEFRVQDAADDTQRVIAIHTFSAGDEEKFHHVVATVTLGLAGENEVQLFVNAGEPSVILGATGDLNDWAGGDAAGLGRINGGIPTGQTGFDAFTGDVAILNYYQAAVLTQEQVQMKFDELSTGVVDSEPDGLPDFWEMAYFGDLDALPGDDGDMDDLTNVDEFEAGTDPTMADSDGDGIDDADELNAVPPTSPTRADTDDDGLDDGDELALGTDPTDPDSDDDGFSDGLEVDNGTDPTDPNDPAAGNGATIIWVSENTDAASPPSPDDMGWNDLLAIQGYTVIRSDIRDLDLNQAALDTLNGADLVIISRDTNSGNYNNGGGEVEAWNTSVTVPLIQLSSFLVRNNRWFWFNNAANPVVGGSVMEAIEPAHPIFAGITLDANNQFEVIEEEQVNVTGQLDAGNGTVIATDPSSGNVWIAHWEEGVEFYAGSGQTTGAQRLWFGAGVVDNDPKGGENFTTDGETAFLNAVNFMLGGATPELRVTEITYDQASDEISITWSSKPTATYSLFYSGDLTLGFEENDSIPSDGESTTIVLPNPMPDADRLYFQVLENQ